MFCIFPRLLFDFCRIDDQSGKETREISASLAGRSEMERPLASSRIRYRRQHGIPDSDTPREPVSNSTRRTQDFGCQIHQSCMRFGPIRWAQGRPAPVPILDELRRRVIRNRPSSDWKGDALMESEVWIKRIRVVAVNEVVKDG